MGPVGTLAGILGLSVVSGINLYATVLTVGLCLRFGWVSGLPPEMQILAHPAILIIAGVLYLAEFIADKIPFFTPIWDAIHTFVRPLGGALLAVQAAAGLSPLAQTLAALLGGSVALGSHTTKASLRLVAHANPEPVSHSLLSIAEDVGVVGLVLLAFKYPEVALPVLAILLALMAYLAPLLLRLLRFMVGGPMGVALRWIQGPRSEALPEWVSRTTAKLAALERPVAFRCFSRSGSGFGRFREVWVARSGKHWWIAYKRWTRPTARVLNASWPLQCSLQKGLLCDVLTVDRESSSPETYYVTKEWAGQCRQMLGLHPPTTHG